jgi:hypothetical protein
MSHMGGVSIPLARSDGLLMEQVGDETVIFDTESKEAHCLSPLAAAVYAECDGRSSPERISELAASRLGEPVSVEHVEAALAQLEERGLLVGPPGGMTRRGMVRRTAAATAALSAAPLITSIVTPAFGQNGTPVDRRCPGATCSSQSAGDDFCACVNECSCDGVDPGDCDPDAVTDCMNVSQDNCPTGQSVNLMEPKLESCECLSPDELRARGITPPVPVQCPSCSSPQNPGPGGCIDPNAMLDGQCFRIAGDSTELCPET